MTGASDNSIIPNPAPTVVEACGEHGPAPVATSRGKPLLPDHQPAVARPSSPCFDASIAASVKPSSPPAPHPNPGCAPKSPAAACRSHIPSPAPPPQQTGPVQEAANRAAAVTHISALAAAPAAAVAAPANGHAGAGAAAAAAAGAPEANQAAGTALAAGPADGAGHEPGGNGGCPGSLCSTAPVAEGPDEGSRPAAGSPPLLLQQQQQQHIPDPAPQPVATTQAAEEPEETSGAGAEPPPAPPHQLEQRRESQAGSSSPAGPAAQVASSLLSDPDYEVPRGTLTETQVLLSLLEQKQGQRLDNSSSSRPVKVDRYGFVLAVQEDGSDDGGDGRRRDIGAAASTSGAAGLAPRLERLLDRELRLPLRQRRRRRATQQAEQQYAARLRKWRKMLGGGGAALEEYRRRRPEKFKRRVRKGVPDPLRGLAWLAISGGRKLKESNPGLFAALLSLKSCDAAPAPMRDAPATPPASASATASAAAARYSAPSADVTLCIMRDLNRTFPNNIYFMQRQGPGQKALFSVLWATAAYRPAVGYVQGMGFLAAVLLLYMEAEEAFWTLQAMLQGAGGWPEDQGGMERLYTAGMPGLQCCLYQFKRLLREVAPRLAARLDREGVDPELYATHWFNTAFAYTLPFPHLLRVWDSFLAEGPKTLFRVGLAVLQYAEGRLLGLRFEALLAALSARKLPELLPPDPHQLLARASRIAVSRRLGQLREEWQQLGQQGRGRGRQGGGGRIF
ncbi:hypothetical protein PLESTB_001141800 [Pleodorina starrii]|uniref:Rab-GAP TBC domain-containing protein n=1 Tax=Pleodorina starrii TaxID=330485 RepID=A0A9W6BSL3_9CHLO|nr:hypothetical protein PLESTM_000562800 [Pleodorina starrii]GLC56751.1 hypothetical protein PLESTB_001141800 [Pleodorina starrii]